MPKNFKNKNKLKPIIAATKVKAGKLKAWAVKDRRNQFMSIMLILLLLIPIGSVLTAFLTRPVEAAWFDIGYSFRKLLPVTNASGSLQTDFQLQATIDTATLIAAGKMQSDCDDIRFTDVGGKSLGYWLEPNTCNTASTLVWFKAESIPTTGADIYFYYGNPGATSESSTNSTFIRDQTPAAVAWPLDDTTATQSYSRDINPAVATGVNIIQNGTFDSGTNWTPGAGWAIASGTLNATSSSSNTSQASSVTFLTIGKVYQITFTVSGYSTGNVRVNAGSTGDGTLRSANGTYVENIICTGDNAFRVIGSSSFTGSVDNIIVNQVNIPASPNIAATQLVNDANMETAGVALWNAGNSATLTKNTTAPLHGGAQHLRIARNGVNNPYASQGVLTVGTIYRLTGYARSDGSAVPIVSGGNNYWTGGTTSTVWQPFDLLFKTVGNTSIAFGCTTSTGTQFCEYDDVAVSVDTGIRQGELTQDGGVETWTSATDLTNWSENIAGTTTVNREASVINSGSFAVRFDVDGSNSVAQITQNILALGKTYKISFWAKASTTGKNIGSDSGLFTNTPTLTTTYTYYEFTGVAASITLNLKRNTGTSASLYIDDISVTEVSPLVGKPLLGVTLGSSSGAGGHLTNAYTFDGTNDNVNIYSTDLNSLLNVNEGSLVAWVKYTGSWSDATGRQIAILYSDANNRIDIFKNTVNNQISFQYMAGGVSKSVSDISLGGTANWFQVMITWSKSLDQMKAYINGVQVGSTQTGLGTWVGNLLSTNATIGAANTSGSGPWTGMINDVRLYDRPLSSTEVSSQYSASSDIQAYTTTNYLGKELFRKYNTSVTLGALAAEEVGPGPSAYWKLDDGTGQTLQDSTTKNLDGTLGANTGVSTDDPSWQTEDMCMTGKCLAFDGTSDYAAIQYVPGVTPTGTYSISLWFNKPSITNSALINISNGTANRNGINFSGTTIQGGYWNGSAYTGKSGNFTPNQWNHVVLINNGGTVTLYLNGRALTGTTLGGLGLAENQIGYNSNINAYFDGRVDDVKVYTYVRSQAQVLSEFNLGSTSLGKKDQAAFLSDNLVGYWKMDENTGSTTADSSSHNFTGTLTNTPTWVQGKFGSSLYFTASSNQYVTATDTTGSALDITGAYSAAAWVNPTSFPNAANYVVTKGAQLYGFYINSSNKVVPVENGSSKTASVASITTGVWTHILVTYDGSSSISIYINGVLDSVQSTAVILNTDNNPLQISHSLSTVDFDGIIDEVRIYNRSFSAIDVANLYNWSTNPTAYYPLDEKTGTNTNDTSGNSNIAALENGATWTTGKVGGAVSFDGTDDDINIPDLDNKNDFNYNQDFTVSVWVKIPSTAQTNVVNTANDILEKRGGSGGFAYRIQFLNSTHGTSANKIEMARYDGTNIPELISTSTYNDNQWHYLTFSKNGTTLSMYIDGKFDKSTTDTTTTTTTNASALYVGKRGDGLLPFTGSVDDIKIYNYGRSLNQIQEDFNIASSSGVAGTSVGVLPDPLAYYKFDEQNGQTVRNSGTSGSSLNGTLGANSSASTDDPGWRTGTTCKTNGCLNFDGGDFVNLGNLADFKVASKTISFWANPPSTISTTAPIISNGGANYYAGFGGSNSGLTSHTIGAGTQQTTPRASFVTVGSWSYYAYTFDVVGSNVTISFYKNGAKVGSTSYATGYNSTYGTAFILGSFSSGSLFYTGLLDEFKFYNVSLTPEQIKLDYNAGAALNFGTTGSLESTLLTDGAGNPPTGYWNLDEKTDNSCVGGTNDVCDKSGNGNDGAASGGPTWSSGKIGSAMKFDGVNDEVTLTGPVVSTNATLEGWFYWESGTATLFRDDTSTSITGWILAYDVTGNLAYRLGDTTFNTTIPTSSVQNKWTHYAVTKSGATNKYYINGILLNSGSGGASTASTSPWHIMRNGSSSNYIKGMADDIKIYDYARTAAQIAYDYNRGAPVAWWKVDECQGASLNDSTGNSNTATITPATGAAIGTCGTGSTMWGNGSSGKINSSLAFDGTDDFASFTRSTSVQSIATQGTISAWAKYTTNDGTLRTLVDISGTGNNGLILLGQHTSCSGSKIGVQYGNGSAPVIACSSTNPTTGIWYHVLATWDSTGAKLYINGKLEGSNVTAPAITIPAGTSWIGSNSGSSRYFNGQIDDVRLYNYSLSASQIKQVYNNGAATFAPVSGNP